MNWRIETTADSLKGHKATVERAEHEPDSAKPDPKVVTAARSAAKSLAAKLGGDVHVTIHGHETTEGEGFKPGYVTVTVSRLDPARESE
jgi:hypothetical protein